MKSVFISDKLIWEIPPMAKNDLVSALVRMAFLSIYNYGYIL